MDALIRAARLAPFRRRLSDARAPVDSADPAQTRSGTAETQAQQLRHDIEAQLRAELATRLEEIYQRERERAHADGYADGLEGGKAVMAQELAKTREQLIVRADAVMSALEDAHEAALRKLEASVGEVAFAAVCNLVGHRAAAATFARGLIEQACAKLRSDALATLRLHPRDIEALGDWRQGDGELRIQSLALRLVPDESLELGGCVIEAASGSYEGGLESQLRRLHAILTDRG